MSLDVKHLAVKNDSQLHSFAIRRWQMIKAEHNVETTYKYIQNIVHTFKHKQINYGGQVNI